MRPSPTHGELTRARQVLTAELAPGTEATWDALTDPRKAPARGAGHAAVVAGSALRFTALRKPDEGVRAVAGEDVFGRLVARTLAKKWAQVFDAATRPYQFALQAGRGRMRSPPACGLPCPCPHARFQCHWVAGARTTPCPAQPSSASYAMSRQSSFPSCGSFTASPPVTAGGTPQVYVGPRGLRAGRCPCPGALRARRTSRGRTASG